jgi:hypothetical protein
MTALAILAAAALVHSLGRREAVEAGRGLVRRGLVRHVLDEHGFEDANLFYRFAADTA